MPHMHARSSPVRAYGPLHGLAHHKQDNELIVAADDHMVGSQNYGSLLPQPLYAGLKGWASMTLLVNTSDPL